MRLIGHFNREEATKRHNARLIDGKLTVTMPQNESQSSTLCIIFMLMFATRQLFHPTGENTSFLCIIFLLVILQNTNQFMMCVCVRVHKLTKKLF